MKFHLFILIGILSCTGIRSQEDLLSLVDDKKDEKPKKVFATFKTYRIGNAQTVETVKKRHLDFRIGHRFGNIYDADLKQPVNSMFQTAFGILDAASDIRLGLDYGVTEKLTVGLGISRLNKIVDGTVKFKILEQTSDFSMPVTVTFFSSTGYTHARTNEQILYAGVTDASGNPIKTNELHRLSFFNQLIIASKITNWLSLEILPAYMYRNFVRESVNPKNNAADPNGFFTIGFGGRVKITKRTSIIGDYYLNAAPYYMNNPSAFNPLSLGFEIETGGHVFSLFFTNASGLIENNFIPYTNNTWTKGQVKFGFTISRTFSL
jgi:hypothetical protein